MLRKFKVLFVIASLAITLSLMSNTYSRYVASSQGNVEIEFAKWQILVNNTDVTTSANTNMTFTPTIVPNENVAANKVAPSSIGYFDIEIDPTNVDVSFKYTIDLNIDNTNIPDLRIIKYSFVPENYVEGNALDYTYLENTTSSSITQDIEYGNNNYMSETTVDGVKIKKFKKMKIRVFFEWIEGTSEHTNDTTGEVEQTFEETMSNVDDTAVGYEAASNDTTFTINANISFEQIIN